MSFISCPLIFLDLTIFHSYQDLYGFMSVPSSSSLDDKKNEIEYLKQTMENFARMSEIIEKIEQDILTNSRFDLIEF